MTGRQVIPRRLPRLPALLGVTTPTLTATTPRSRVNSCPDEERVYLTRHMLLGERENFMLDYAAAYVEKPALHHVPTVHLGRNELVGMTLTLDEARELREQVINLTALGGKG